MEADRTKWRIALRLAVIAAIVAALAAYIWQRNFRTYHFVAVQEGVLYRDGMRSLDELGTACRLGRVKTVIGLIDDRELDQEPFSLETKFCSRSKMKFVQLPVLLGGWPTSAQIGKFLDLVQEQKLQPVLVHCAQGVRRTGMMVAAYQLSVLGWDKAKAKAAILSFGHSDKTVNDIRRFIDDYDPQKRQMTAVLAPSKE